MATLIAVGLVAGATLAYQVVLTRLFSAVLPYHFSFLAISIALLGTGGGLSWCTFGGNASRPIPWNTCLESDALRPRQ